MFAQSITQQQADDILNELRAIRQTLERMGQPPVPQPGPPAPAPDEKVKLPDVTGVMMGRPDAPVTIIDTPISNARSATGSPPKRSI